MATDSTRSSGLTGVILAAGEGSRIRQISGAIPKAALPVGNRALILHHIDGLCEAGITDVVIVIGAGAAVLRGIVDGDPVARAMRIRYVEQPERRGIAHAVSCASAHIESDFVLLLADVFMPDHRMQDAIGVFRVSGCSGVLGAKREHDPQLMRRNFSIETVDGLVKRVVEKPPSPTQGLKGVGTYVFTRAIFEAIGRTPISSLRGEQEITDAVQVLIDSGAPVRAVVVTENDINVNDPRSLLLANLAVLEARGRHTLIAESARVHPTARLDRTVLGPGTSVGAGVELSECIVLEGAAISEPGRHTRQIFTPECTVSADAAPDGNRVP